jgi:DNA replication protein DnaC
LAAIDRAADSWLMHRAGLSPREVGARVERIPASISSAVTRSLVMLMVDPRDLTPIAPTHGFGLAGNAGVGKTFAIAAWMRAAFVTRVNRFAKSDGRQVARRWLRWVRWPEMVSTWRSEATIDNGYLRATEFAKELGEAEALVIDDLGAERMKGAYTDDWTISLLDLVIDRRYNERRPTWYTTNLSRAAFAERYGARFYSRLCMANPLFEISGAKDLRGELGR